ncbi:MAG TPA: hypothetical protein DEA90_09700 [Opitutae bacterium]|nr:hypothetical protein [Puniceicoccaceae bacterium]HBR94424.1 hypothetical protein [Opitutae bacterium]|tara:strand:+ start:936 stop:1949 length:1014 start_codon:yes stop_codon:yes gene_type:complete
MFYRRDIEDKKRPKPMRSFSPDVVVGFEPAKHSKKGNTLWFVAAVFLMITVIAALIVILQLYFSHERKNVVSSEGIGNAEQLERRLAEQMEAARAAEDSRASRAPDAYELLSEPKLLQAYLSANGGREELFSLETMQLEGQVTWAGQRQAFELFKLNSNLMRLTLNDGERTTAFGFDGQSFWQSTEDESMAGGVSYSLLSLAEQERFFACRRFFDPLMAYALRGQGTLQVIEFGEWQGKTAIRVQLRGASSNRIDVFVSPKTLRVIGLVERVRATGVERSVAYSDFQNVDGYYIPFRREAMLAGEIVYDMKVTSCRPNADVPSALFMLPDQLANSAR